MGIIEVFCLFLFLECVFTEEDALLKPCAVEDIDCLSQTTEKFLEKTSAGIPQFDIKPIDPLLIPSIDVTFPEYILHSKNLKITGLKNQKISVFTMNKASKSVVLATSTTLNIVADVSLELPKLSKVFAGNYSIITDALATARYNYDLKTDASGVEHFEVGPETISCENLKSPVMTLNQELVEALRKDSANLIAAAKKFIVSTSAGIPEKNLKATDPLSIDDQEYPAPGVKITFKNIKVTGFKDLDITDIKVDSEAQTAKMIAKPKLVIDADATFSLTDLPKSFSGGYKVNVAAETTVSYGYEFKKDAEGVERLVIGPETTVCVINESPSFTLEPELANALKNDPDVKELMAKNKDKQDALRKNIFCKIIEKAFAVIVENRRIATKTLTKSAFLATLE